MREVTNFDQLSTFHYCAVAFFIILFWFELKLLRSAFKKNKPLRLFFIGVGILITGIFALFVYTIASPGGGLNEAQYRADRAIVKIYQANLELFKQKCQKFPTTEQGLGALTKWGGCNYVYNPKDWNDTHMVYTSDGNTYTLIKDVQRRIFSMGTDKYEAKIFIDESKKDSSHENACGKADKK